MEGVPDDYIKAVVFLCVEKIQDDGTLKREPRATGFFVAVHIDDLQSGRVDYIVTARHCIEEARAEGYQQIFVQLNPRTGPYVEVPTSLDDWIGHDNADVAAIPVLAPAFANIAVPGGSDHTSLNTSSFVGPGPNYEWKGSILPGFEPHTIQPRVGHQIYFIGLFTESYGEERNLPIARFGNISRMPEAIIVKFPGNVRTKITAYLADLRSWGGHSGCPAFFMYPMVIESESDHDTRSSTDLAWVTGFLAGC